MSGQNITKQSPTDILKLESHRHEKIRESRVLMKIYLRKMSPLKAVIVERKLGRPRRKV